MSDVSTVSGAWRDLGAVSPRELVGARLQAHWAAQPIAYAGHVWATPRPDGSHTAATWDSDHNAVVGVPLPSGHRVALRLADLTLQVLDQQGAPVDNFHLAGRTLADGLAWTGDAIARATGDPPRPLTPPPYDMPAHALGDDAPFDAGDRASLEELARWYSNGAAALSAVSTRHGNVPVRLWPHHFDIAMLLTLDPDEPDAEKARSIGVGFSPGDETHAEPYAYVAPWPPPAADDLPPLDGGGAWITEGWVGSTLVGSALVDAADAPAQILAFFASAIDANRALLTR